MQSNLLFIYLNKATWFTVTIQKRNVFTKKEDVMHKNIRAINSDNQIRSTRTKVYLQQGTSWNLN